MNQSFELRNKLVKAIVLTSASLLEAFQWGKQSASEEQLIVLIAQLENQITELKESLGESVSHS
jgi:hypothetical protein